jgi:hypothetical protein
VRGVQVLLTLAGMLMVRLVQPLVSRSIELTPGNVGALLELSVRLGVAALTQQCCDYLGSAIDQENACEVFELAHVRRVTHPPMPLLALAGQPGCRPRCFRGPSLHRAPLS